MDALPTCLSMHHMQAMKRASDPGNWRNIWLRAVVWVVGIKPESSGRSASADQALNNLFSSTFLLFIR